jgi:hypothetical protein
MDANEACRILADCGDSDTPAELPPSVLSNLSLLQQKGF